MTGEALTDEKPTDSGGGVGRDVWLGGGTPDADVVDNIGLAADIDGWVKLGDGGPFGALSGGWGWCDEVADVATFGGTAGGVVWLDCCGAVVPAAAREYFIGGIAGGLAGWGMLAFTTLAIGCWVKFAVTGGFEANKGQIDEHYDRLQLITICGRMFWQKYQQLPWC
jgi:hypothetical protein